MKDIADRLRSRAASALQPRLPGWPVFPADVLAADFARPYLPPVPPVRDGEPIRLN
ncbi:MAG: glycosyltransferase family 1 protein, partial [Comamonadaceae bacterium]